MNKKEIDNILINVDSFNRFQTFLTLSSKLKGKNYWYALRSAYESSDNLYPYKSEVKLCFLSNEPHRKNLMTSEERNFLTKLPEKVKVYRGMTEQEYKSGEFGISWTLKKEVAEFFAFKYQRNFSTQHNKKVVHEMTIDKNSIICFWNGRKEFEIITA